MIKFEDYELDIESYADFYRTCLAEHDILGDIDYELELILRSETIPKEYMSYLNRVLSCKYYGLNFISNLYKTQIEEFANVEELHIKPLIASELQKFKDIIETTNFNTTTQMGFDSETFLPKLKIQFEVNPELILDAKSLLNGDAELDVCLALIMRKLIIEAATE